jgi:hypothetical protein
MVRRVTLFGVFLFTRWTSSSTVRHADRTARETVENKRESDNEECGCEAVLGWVNLSHVNSDRNHCAVSSRVVVSAPINGTPTPAMNNASATSCCWGVYASERGAVEARVKYWNAKARGSARL